MRTLIFETKEQELIKSPLCDFTHIVSGTSGYLKARFTFGSGWTGCNKVAVFSTMLQERPVPLKNNECVIPEEILKYSSFELYVVGKRPKEEYMITTNKVTVQQEMR